MVYELVSALGTILTLFALCSSESDICSANKGIPWLLWKSIFHWGVHTRLPIEPIPRQLNPFYIRTPYFWTFFTLYIKRRTPSGHACPFVPEAFFL